MTMDYKEKYEQALERAKEMCVLPTDKATMEYIFPELKENYGEKIRKELIEHIKANYEADYMLFKRFPPDDVLAWLEKQGEKKTEMIDKACKWLERHLHHDNVGGFWADATGVEDFINQFKSGCSEIPTDLKGVEQ